MAARYYLAPSLVTLRNEVNAAHPARDKTSDGWIGDTAHAARKSDHNPDWDDDGVVRALDIDHDGIDRHKLRQVAIADPRTEYVIQDGYIYTRANGFRRQKYTGSNPHDKHTHISIRHTASAQKSGRWGYVAGSGRLPTTDKPGPGGTAPDGTPWGSGKPIDVVAREVIRGEWGSGTDRVNRLRNALYDPDLVQRTVNAIMTNRPLPEAPSPKPSRKSVDQIADEVLRGDWGNGMERQRRIAAAGYNYAEVRDAVNNKAGGGGSQPARLSVSALAQQVIEGAWGNHLERRRRLAAAGYNYAEIQAEVNRRLKQ